MSLIKLVYKASPFGMVPYILMMLFIIGYLAYGKYKVRVQLKNIPFSTILQIDLAKVKQNLRIESIVYSFLLVLSILEMSINASGILMQINNDLTNFTVEDLGKIENSSWIFQLHLTHRFTISEIFFASETILMSLMPPIMCLFLIVLRRAYLNLPYRRWIKGYTVFILVRFLFLLVLYTLTITSYLAPMIYFPFCLIDSYVYFSSCRSFYLLLKGRSEEARWHSTQRDYRVKHRIRKQFFYSQILTSTCGILVLIICFILFIKTPLLVTVDIPNYLNRISLGLFPSLLLSDQINNLIISLVSCLNWVNQIIIVILGSLVSLAYLSVCIGIVLKFIRKRKQFNHVNDWLTRPLMERYRASLENRHCGQRAPFIQAFRSHLVV